MQFHFSPGTSADGRTGPTSRLIVPAVYRIGRLPVTIVRAK